MRLLILFILLVPVSLSAYDGLREFPESVVNEMNKAFEGIDFSIETEVWVQDLGQCQIRRALDVNNYVKQFIYDYSNQTRMSFDTEEALTEYLGQRSFLHCTVDLKRTCFLAQDGSARFCLQLGAGLQ